MSDTPTLTRRTLLRRGALIPLATVPLMHGCGQAGSQCADPSLLSRGEEQMRKTREYAEISPFEQKNCANCPFFSGHVGQECGHCEILDGAVNQGGHCNSWAERG